jgi:pimeloyl-ACP methyl ester carboxylesterase
VKANSAWYALCILIALSWLSAQAAVTNLQATFRAGKTFITWTQEAGTGKTYNLYRSISPITNVTSLTPLVNVPDSSSYDKRYGLYHVIEDTGRPLSAATGLFVYTPHDTVTAYYAVTVLTGGTEDKSIVAGQNSLSSGVHEEYWKHPLGVMRKPPFTSTCQTCGSYYFFYWMDYFDWPNKRDYYGDWYYVIYYPDVIGAKNVPVVTYYHGWSGSTLTGLPSVQAQAGVIRLCVQDNYIAPEGHDWWYGVSNHYGEHAPATGDTIVDYTEERILAYLQALAHDSRFSVDTNRFYLIGGSMGGMGTAEMAFHHPDIFAAHAPYIPFLSIADHTEFPQIASWDFPLYYGHYSQGLTARNSINIYKWMNPTWVASHNVNVCYPPIVTYSGSIDGTCPPYWQANFLSGLNKTRHGIWAQWIKVGHTMSGNWSEGVPGDIYRFKRGELFPAFSNATQNDNYGHVDSVSEFGAPYLPADFVMDTAGAVNGYIDWTSSLHKMGLAQDSLIDCADSIVMTLKSDRANTRADITPRRIQRFAIASGNAYHWTNRAVSGWALVDSGTVTADTFGLITIPQFAISGTGNRLVITRSNGAATEVSTANPGGLNLAAYPNPSSSKILFQVRGTAFGSAVLLKVYDAKGRLVFRRNVGASKDGNGAAALIWNGCDGRGIAAPSGVYIARLECGGKALTRVIQLIR